MERSTLRVQMPRLFGAGVAIFALALAACSKSNSVPPTPVASATPTPSSTTSVSASASPIPGSVGIAYVPDAGVGSLSGVQVVHVEDTNGNLLPAASPMSVQFIGSVGAFEHASDGSVALALVRKPGGAYVLAQAVFGLSGGSIVPTGSTYDASSLPSASPSSSPSPGATATPVPSPLPVISDVTGLSILGTGSNSVALLVGPSTQGFLGITSLSNAPPQYGGFAPFQGSTQTVSVMTTPRTNIEALLDGSGNYGALVRGPSDLISLQISLVGSGYQFKIGADDTTLGYSSTATLRGHGAFAIDPIDATRALIGQTTSSSSTLTLVTGLPSAITRSSTLSVAGAINTVEVFPTTGTYAAVGAANGFYIVSGLTSGSLAFVAPSMYTSASDMNAYSPTFIDCNGKSARLVNVTSVAFSEDGKYLIALGSGGSSCSSGANSTVVAVPINLTSGVVATPSPAPTASGSATAPPAQFTQNNIVTPPTGVDYMTAF